MLNRILAVAFIGSALVLTACGGGDGETDDGTNVDVVVNNDAVTDDVVVNPDAHDRDNVTPVDTVVPVDTVTPEDTNVPVDTNVPEDTNVPVDTNVPEDTVITECSGACTFGTDTLFCLADGTTVCYCGQENTWTPFVCAEICTENGMVGDQCGMVDGSPNCMCDYDCTATDLVATQCENLDYTPCTCGAADPCTWLADGYCDGLCATEFVDDHFTDTDDCNCAGECNPDEFAGFCTLDGNACACEGTAKTQLSCADYCTGLGAEVDPEEGCFAYQGVAYCNCINYTCDDSEKVAAQCGSNSYTPCTCAVADPCEWANDGEYCDSVSCNEMFPNQDNFDDSTTDCAQG